MMKLKRSNSNLNISLIRRSRFFGLVIGGDLASVALGTDENVLAIPQHRIHYFKYKDTKIWDRDSRLDLVFGSTEKSVVGDPPQDSFSIETVLEDIDRR